MKKFIFSLAALMMMVCTAVSLCSCGSDDDDNTPTTVSCKATWSGIEWKTIPSQTSMLTAAGAIVIQMNTRTTELLGSTFDLEAKDGKPTEAAIKTVLDKLAADETLEKMADNLSEMGVKYVNFYITSADGNTQYYVGTDLD